MKKVLVVSYFFPPLNNMGAKRFGTMCKYFKEYGYETIVLTSNSHANSFLNTKLDLSIPEGIHQIIRIGRTGVSYIPETVSSQMVVQWINQSDRQSRTLSSATLGWYEKVKREIDLLQLNNIDIIIGTYPPMENLLVASYLSRKLKCPFVTDIRDLITEYSENTSNQKRSFIIDSIAEKVILHRAAGIVPATKGFADILRKKYPKSRIKVIYNGWEDREERTKIRGAEVGYLYYAGALYSHRLESFRLLIDCLKEVLVFKEIRMKIRSIGPETLDMKMKKMIRDNDMEDHIELLEAVEEGIVKREQANAGINIVLSSICGENQALLTTVPGKLYEILKEEAPILAVTPETSDMAHIINKTEKGIATVSKGKIIDFILNADRNYSGNQYVDFFSRKNQAKRYCRFLDSILS